MTTPRVSLVFHPHFSRGEIIIRPTDFAAQKLKLLVEGTLGTNKKIYFVHERIGTFPIDHNTVELFERYLKNRKFMKLLTGIYEKERKQTIADFSKADFGETSNELNPTLSPEYEVVLSTNRLNPGTIVNLLNEFPYEAVIKTTAEYVHFKRANLFMYEDSCSPHDEVRISRAKRKLF